MVITEPNAHAFCVMAATTIPVLILARFLGERNPAASQIREDLRLVERYKRKAEKHFERIQKYEKKQAQDEGKVEWARGLQDEFAARLASDEGTRAAVAKVIPADADPVSFVRDTLNQQETILQENAREIERFRRSYEDYAAELSNAAKELNRTLHSSNVALLWFTAVGLVAGTVGELLAMFGTLQTSAAAYYVVPGSAASIWALMTMLAYYGWNKLRIGLRIDEGSKFYLAWTYALTAILIVSVNGFWIIIGTLATATYK